MRVAVLQGFVQLILSAKVCVAIQCGLGALVVCCPTQLVVNWVFESIEQMLRQYVFVCEPSFSRSVMVTL